jgi:hypothetical protein
MTKTRAKPPIRAIRGLVDYLAHDEIRYLADLSGEEEAEGGIAQHVIKVARWLGGEDWQNVKDQLDGCEIVRSPSGMWFSKDEDEEEEAA